MINIIAIISKYPTFSLNIKNPKNIVVIGPEREATLDNKGFVIFNPKKLQIKADKIITAIMKI
jgi:hypothetical protein